MSQSAHWVKGPLPLMYHALRACKLMRWYSRSVTHTCCKASSGHEPDIQHQLEAADVVDDDVPVLAIPAQFPVINEASDD